MDISAKTNVLAVVGNPVKHSLSPKIHNFISQKTGLDYVYTAFEPENFQSVPEAVKALGIRGINVTAPFKNDAARLVDRLSDDARFCGSVNTIVNDKGILTGYSTDGEGLYLSMMLHNIDVSNKKVLVLGAGGAAKPVCVMLKNKGATCVTVKNRTVSKAEELCRELNSSMNTNIFSVFGAPTIYDIIINTTSVGLGTDENPITDVNLYNGVSAAVDLIYYPKKTTFLKEAEKMGIKTLGGIGMLVFQAVLAYEHFTQTKVPEYVIEEVLRIVNE